MSKEIKLRNSHCKYYLAAAKKLGISYKVIGEDLVEFNSSHKSWQFYYADTSINNAVSAAIAKNKFLTSALLLDHNLPAPRSYLVKNIDEILSKAKQLGFPNKEVVIKPNKGIGGQGITIGANTPTALKKAYKLASTFDKFKQIIIEEFIQGTHYRILIAYNKIIAVAKRLPAHVYGDGEHTIKQLISIKNAVPGGNVKHKVTIDNEVLKTLRIEGLKLSSIPTNKQLVYLRQNSNLSTGGSTIDMSNQIHPRNASLCLKAVKILRLNLAGVDLIISDISKPYSKGNGYINEINHNPGLNLHYEAKNRPLNDDVALTIQQLILKNLVNSSKPK